MALGAHIELEDSENGWRGRTRVKERKELAKFQSLQSQSNPVPQCYPLLLDRNLKSTVLWAELIQTSLTPGPGAPHIITLLGAKSEMSRRELQVVKVRNEKQAGVEKLQLESRQRMWKF